MSGGIPQAADTDAEDVVWALQTADTLWKRGEHVDAIVWLRRAAQAAGEAEDDDRALALARYAAELSEWIAQHRSATHTSGPGSSPPSANTSIDDLLRQELPRYPSSPPSVADDDEAPTQVVEPATALRAALTASRRPAPPPAPPPLRIPSAVATSPFGVAGETTVPASAPSADVVHAGILDPWAEGAEPEDDAPTRTVQAVEHRPVAPPLAMDQAPEPVTEKAVPQLFAGDTLKISVAPPALDEEEEHTQTVTAVSVSGAIYPQPTVPEIEPAAPEEDEEEVLTSARALSTVTSDVRIPAAAPAPPPPAPSAAPPPAPSAAPKAAPPARPAPPPVPRRPPPPPPTAAGKPPPPPTSPRARPPLAPPPPPLAPATARPQPAAPGSGTLPGAFDSATHRVASDLRTLEAEARRAIEAEAEEQAEATREIDMSAIASQRQVSSAPAANVEANVETGTLPVYRQTHPPTIEMTQPPGAVDLHAFEAFADIPDDTRVPFAVAAKVHYLKKDEEASGFALAAVVQGDVDVAATIVDAPAQRLHEGAVLRARGTVGDGMAIRLVCASDGAIVATWDAAAVATAFKTCPWVEDDLRAAADRMQALVGITMGQIAERLDAEIRHQITARLAARTLAPGEVIVQKGQPMPGIVLVGVGELETVGDEELVVTVGPGEFLFPSTVLAGGSAPSTSRAGPEGAVALVGDRQIAQELMVTCPPLLELFAGM